jgi:hypothetical protein
MTQKDTSEMISDFSPAFFARAMASHIPTMKDTANITP